MKIGASLAAIDPASAALEGATSDSGPARRFMDALRLEAETSRAGVLVIAHDTKSARNEARAGGDPGAGAGAGSSAWFDAARGVLYLRRNPTVPGRTAAGMHQGKLRADRVGHPAERGQNRNILFKCPRWSKFGLFAEVERDLISERTKEGLAAAKAKGKLLGRPKGALGKSKLDGKEEDIRMLLGKEVSKASIAKILDVSRSALCHFIETRKIVPD